MKDCFAQNHKWMIGYLSKLYIGIISLQRWKWYKVKVFRWKVKVKLAVFMRRICSTTNHELVIGSSLIRCMKRIDVNETLKWHKVKVVRSKVKVKFVIIWKHCFCFKSKTDIWTLIKFIHRIDFNVECWSWRKVKVTRSKVKVNYKIQ